MKKLLHPAGMALVFLFLGFSACSPHYLSSRPMMLKSCFTYTDKAQEYSFKSMLLALESKGWIIMGVDEKKGIIRATACRSDYCLEVDVAVGETGLVRVMRTPEQRIGRGGSELLKHWMKHLRRAHRRYCYFSPERLNAETTHLKYPPFPAYPPVNPQLLGGPPEPGKTVPGSAGSSL